MEQIFQFFSEEESAEVLTDSEFESDYDSDESDLGPEFGTEERALKVRLDKWLWAARFFKTRAVARAAVEKGKVFYNGERSKPSREIEIGALLQIRQGRYEKTVIVKGLSTRRRSTEEALQLFEETEESRSMREQMGEYVYAEPVREHQGAYPYFYANEQPKERRAVRFLRRSIGNRGEPQPQRQNKNAEYANQFEFECDTVD